MGFNSGFKWWKSINTASASQITNLFLRGCALNEGLWITNAFNTVHDTTSRNQLLPQHAWPFVESIQNLLPPPLPLPLPPIRAAGLPTHPNIQSCSTPLSLCKVATEIECCLLFCMDVKLGRLHWGRNVGWGCLRIGHWWEYLGLRGTR